MNDADTLRLSANGASPEAVVDVYKSGHIVVAEQLGPGLALAEEKAWYVTLPRGEVPVRGAAG